MDIRADEVLIRDFSDRAVRICATAAAQRQDLATVGTTIGLLAKVGTGALYLQREYLPESELRDAASLIRPLTQNEDYLYFRKVIKSMKKIAYARENTQLARDYKITGKELDKRLHTSRWEIHRARGSTAEKETNLTLAHIWFNAHAWHSDEEKIRQVTLFSEEECLVAASVWVADWIYAVRLMQVMLCKLQEA